MTLHVQERFSSKYRIDSTGCWIWTAARITASPTSKKERGTFNLNGHGPVLAHRASYSIFKGEIPLGKLVLHRCDQPLCVNPDHLFIGTQKENMQDMAIKGRRVLSGITKLNKEKTHCKNGHEFSNENTNHAPGNRRECRTCGREKMRLRRLKYTEATND